MDRESGKPSDLCALTKLLASLFQESLYSHLWVLYKGLLKQDFLAEISRKFALHYFITNFLRFIPRFLFKKFLSFCSIFFSYIFCLQIFWRKSRHMHGDVFSQYFKFIIFSYKISLTEELQEYSDRSASVYIRDNCSSAQSTISFFIGRNFTYFSQNNFR